MADWIWIWIFSRPSPDLHSTGWQSVIGAAALPLPVAVAVAVATPGISQPLTWLSDPSPSPSRSSATNPHSRPGRISQDVRSHATQEVVALENPPTFHPPQRHRERERIRESEKPGETRWISNVSGNYNNSICTASHRLSMVFLLAEKPGAKCGCSNGGEFLAIFFQYYFAFFRLLFSVSISRCLAEQRERQREWSDLMGSDCRLQQSD